jgi:hypothetical protein
MLDEAARNGMEDRLKEQIEKLNKKISGITEERDKTIQQYEENEAMWKAKNNKSQKDLANFLEMNQS